MKNLATPLGLAGFGSHSEANRSRNQFFDWPLVRSIVESHGGELVAENVDEGARFSFRFPVAAKNERGEVA